MKKLAFLMHFINVLPPPEKIATILRFFILDIETIDRSLPVKGTLYDVGCSSGLVSYYLARLPGRRVVGVDINSARINKARLRNSQNLNISFICQDVLASNFPRVKGAVMSDFLHHLDFAKQEKLLRKLYRFLPVGGILVIKEINSAERIRRWLSRLWDFTLYPQDLICYRSKSQWIELLGGIGFSVKARSAVRWFPASTTIFICKKN